MPKLIANRQLLGTFGMVAAEQEFECSDGEACVLVARGLARNAAPPKIEYETKVVVPECPEVSAREPFRDGDVLHEEPAALASAGDQELPDADVPKPGASGGERRRRRPRPHPR